MTELALEKNLEADTKDPPISRWIFPQEHLQETLSLDDFPNSLTELVPDFGVS